MKETALSTINTGVGMLVHETRGGDRAFFFGYLFAHPLPAVAT